MSKTRKLLQTNKIAIWLFATSFIIHLLVSIFLFAKFGENVIFFENEDAHGYVSLAESVLDGRGFAWGKGFTATRTPAYPLFVAFAYALPLPNVWSLLILQNIIASLAAVLLFKIGERLFSARAGLIAGIIYMIEPYMLMTANLATTETFFNFVLIAFAYFFLQWYSCANIRTANTNIRITNNTQLVMSAVLLGIATLTRPAALYAPGVVIILLIIRWIYKTESWKWFIKNSILFVAVFTATLSPWMIRQYARFGTPRITNIDAVMLYLKAAPLAVAAERGVSYDEATQILWQRLKDQFPGAGPGDEYTDFRMYAYMVTEAKELLSRHKAAIFKSYAVSFVPALFGTGYEYMVEEVFDVPRTSKRISYSGAWVERGLGGLLQEFRRPDIFQIILFGGIVVWMAVYGSILFFISSKKTWQEHFLAIFFLLGFTAYFILITLGPAQHARYRMPTFPFLFLLLAAALDFLARVHYHRRRTGS